MSEGKIIVGLSGGVDSSVAALLLHEQGLEIEALFMKNWHETSEDGNCMWEADVEDAMHVCDTLGIHLNTIDLSAEYWDKVFSDFLNEYKSGRTPNPDILCNQEIKFKVFMEQALSLGADKIATGHYARITACKEGYQLRKGVDPNKDQSYFLCRLNQQQLAHTLFPVGELEKSRVRALAEQAGFAVHDKKDSTGICFVGERPFREFLSQYIPIQPGEIQTPEGQVVGQHIGVYFYTLGQRQGLGIGGVKGASDEPWYVVDKDMDKNILFVAQGHDHPLLFSRNLIAKDLHWITGTPPATPFDCMAKTRYRQADQPCTLNTIEGDVCQVQFKTQQRAVTPGQFIVFYQGDLCLGGAVIDQKY